MLGHRVKTIFRSQVTFAVITESLFYLLQWTQMSTAFLEGGDGDLSGSLGQQLLAPVIYTASQIQMENGSHSAALLIMDGTDRAARPWTTGGPEPRCP